MKHGLFITFEGPDGSGKTTQISLLKDYLEEKGQEAVWTREPGGTIIGEKIREIILDPAHKEMSAEAEALLYAASRAQHVRELIMPHLENGSVVICDRFVDSSMAYQAYGRALGSSVEELNQFATGGLTPDVTFLLMVEPESARNRISHGGLDRLEGETLEYHQAVYDGYTEMARRDKDRIIVLDGAMPAEEISRKIRSHVKDLLSERQDI